MSSREEVLSGSQELRICVFGSSAPSTKSKYCDESVKLGKLIAEKGCICVNGAGKYGVMGGLNDGCLSSSGKIKGVIHKKFLVDNGEHDKLEDLIVADGIDLGERKNLLFANADCVICMPGGVGTFDEFWDGVSSRSLGMKGLGSMPLCLVNIDGFYDGFIAQTKRAKEDGMMYLNVDQYYHVSRSVEDALEWCLAQLSNTSYSSSPAQSTRMSTRATPEKRDQSMPRGGKQDSKSPMLNYAVIAIICLGAGYTIGQYSKQIRK